MRTGHTWKIAGLMTAAVLVLGASSALAQPQAPVNVSGLTPGGTGSQSDSQGFNWDINPNGQINDGTSDCFDGANALSINGQGFNPMQQMVHGKTGAYVLIGQVGGFEAMRWIWLDQKNAAVVYVDIIRNSTRSAQTANLSLESMLGGSCQQVVTDQGNPFAGTLGKGDAGVFAMQHPGSRPSVFWLLASERSRTKPVVSVGGNRNFTFTYSLKIPAGRTAGVVHIVGQRHPGVMMTGKALDQLFKPFRSPRYIRELPPPVRAAVTNWGGSFGLDAGAVWTMPDELGLVPGPHDQLAFGEGTLLRGDCAIESLSITGRFGVQKIDPAMLAGLAGPKWSGGRTKVYLRDGQVLTGELALEGVRFTMTSGMTLTLDPTKIDRIVMRADAANGKPAEHAAAYLETFERDRVAIREGGETGIRVITPWGARQVQFDELLALRPMGDSQPGFQIELRDGSRFFAFLGDDQMTLQTLLFGRQTIPTADMRGIVAVQRKPEGQGGPGPAAGELTQPHIVLAGGHVLVGRLDVRELELRASGAVIPAPPLQMRVLSNVTADVDDELASDGSAVFYAEMWGGGTVTGQVDEVVLPFRSGESVLMIATRDIAEVISPTPVVPAAVRVEVGSLIRDLGHPEWEKREAATQRLQDLGVLARQQLEQALKQAQDPEVRRRVQKILDEME